jgi:hypothetical protein
MNTVAERLYDQCSHAKRSSAVLHYPIVRSVNSTSRKWFDALDEPTSIAIRSHSLIPLDMSPAREIEPSGDQDNADCTNIRDFRADR